MTREFKLIFIFSLPRSGSTLLQRILGAHSKIETRGEVWLLLPLLYIIRHDGIFAEYAHASATKAFKAYIDTTARKEQAFHEHAREFAMNLYAEALYPGCHYFLDKTPRYTLIASEVMKMFPDAKFIFLFRNPLAMIASFVETFGGGHWNLWADKSTFFDGCEEMMRAYGEHLDSVATVHYEQLVQDPERVLRPLFEHLELEFEPAVITDFITKTKSFIVGDPNAQKFSGISASSLQKWKKTIRNPLRKRWCRKYLEFIGRERLAMMGYDWDELIDNLHSMPFSLSRLRWDLVDMPLGAAYSACELPLFKWKLRSGRPWHRIYAHF